MSELKAGVLVTPHNEGMCFHRSSAVIAVTEGETEFYLKSEADKVIAEKDAKIARLKATPEEIMKEVFDKVIIYPHEMVRLEDAYKLAVALRRSNRKRCLAMADYCESQYYYYITLGNGFWLVRGDKMTRDTYHKRGEKFLTRWNKIWIALAEEPTWTKFLRLIHKETK